MVVWLFIFSTVRWYADNATANNFLFPLRELNKYKSIRITKPFAADSFVSAHTELCRALFYSSESKYYTISLAIVTLKQHGKLVNYFPYSVNYKYVFGGTMTYYFFFLTYEDNI